MDCVVETSRKIKFKMHAKLGSQGIRTRPCNSVPVLWLLCQLDLN